MTGFATSVIGCGCEAGIDRDPDAATRRRTGGPACACSCSRSRPASLQKQLQNRVGQCVLTSPGSACYAGLDAGEEQLKLGDAIRYFGDGWQISKRLGGRRYWRMPVMDGEFVCEATTGHDQEGGRRRQPPDHGREQRQTRSPPPKPRSRRCAPSPA